MGQDDWYIIITNPQKERKAAGELRRAGLRVYLPRETMETHRRGVTRVRRRPLMCGYLFMRFPGEMMDNRGVPHFALARKCQGVKDFVRSMNGAGEWEPFPVPSRLVASILRRERQHEFDDVKITQNRKEAQRKQIAAIIKTGAKLRVTSGPFASFMATIRKLAKDNSVEAVVNIFGRETVIRFSEPEEAFDLIDIAKAAA